MRLNVISIICVWFFSVLPIVNAQDFSENAAKIRDTRKKTTLEWRASIGGTFMNDSLGNANIVGLDADVRVFHMFSDLFTANIEAGLVLETGSVASLYTDEFHPYQTIFLYEARLNILPTNFLKFHFGALNQSHHGSPIFIGDKTFPAVMEYATIPGIAPWYVSANAQQAIPTSQTLSTRSVEKENTPLLFTENIRGGYRDVNNFELVARGTYFKFQDLTHGIAQDSRFYGNTVYGLGPLGATFYYPFEGWEAGVDSTVHFSSDWKLILGNSFLNNSKAPRPKNRGNFIFGGFGYTGPAVHIIPKFGWMRVESDPVPGFYSGRALGHNNRTGYTTGFEVRLIPEKLKIDATYVNAKVIDTNPLQADRTYFEIRFGTLYEEI